MSFAYGSADASFHFHPIPWPADGADENGEESGKSEGKETNLKKEHAKQLCSDWLVSYETNFS